MPRPQHPPPDESALAAIRQRGADLSEQLLDEQAPANELERLAFVAGAGSVDRVHEAVQACRSAGWTWPQIAAAIGQNMHTVKTKYGTGYEAQARYRERRRVEGTAE